VNIALHSWEIALLRESSPLVFPSAFFEEYLAKDFFLLFVGVIILDVIVARRVEDGIVVVVAVGVAISQFLVDRVTARRLGWLSRSGRCLGAVGSLRGDLRSKKKHTLMKAAYHRDLNGLLLLALCLLALQSAFLSLVSSWLHCLMGRFRIASKWIALHW
jgi:hypothetical protein